MSESIPGDDAGAIDLLDSPSGPTPPPPPAPAASDPAKKRRRLKIVAAILALLLLIVGGVLAWYLLNRKPLTELPGVTQVTAVPTYKTAFYGIDKPLGVAVSPDGSRVYATQGGTKPTTLVFDRDGKKIGELKPPTTDTYHVPVYLAVSPTGDRVYVGDRAAGAVYVYDASGAYVSTFTPKDASVKFSPLGVAVAKDGTLYVADVGSDNAADHRILMFSPDGTLVKTLGKGELNYPNQFVVDDSGDVYVTDSNNGRVAVIDTAGKVSGLISHGVGQGDLGLPRGLAIDDRGRILVVDTTDHMVRLYTKASSLTGTPAYAGSFGDQGVQDGTFLYPNGLAADARGRVYVADRDNNRVQVWGF